MKRLAYIDWMRGLACVLMFQTHCYDSWLSPEARKSALFAWSQLGGTFPAPLFLFLAGVSSALVTERLREKGTPADEIAKTAILRGAEIFGLGLLFRLQEFILGYRWVPWTDLLRVDILNILGISMILMGVLSWLGADRGLANGSGADADYIARLRVANNSRNRGIVVALAAAAIVALATPALWTNYRPHWLSWPIESYINGVHTFDKPQPWLFPLFPWSAFAFVGLAIGSLTFTALAKRKEALLFALLGGAGLVSCISAGFFDWLRVTLYSTYDYWHTSPNFFLMRCGLLLAILFLVYAWCRWGLAQVGFSPVIQLGKTSLLVYWVHIEFVYGRFSILPKRQCSILQATVGLLVIFLAMLALSMSRTYWKNRGAGKTKATAPVVSTA